jgi:hypothetical protein
MPVIDDRGRLFGRMNLIDALVLVLVVVLIPIAYTAFMLFRTPAPRITAVEPSQVPLGLEMRVKVRGTGLRSLFRANIGEMPASAYLFENERSADVLFSNVGPGKYDLSLFDGVQEVARLKGAVTILPPPIPATTKVRITGALIGLDAGRASQLARGQRFPANGTPSTEILAIGKPRTDERWIKTPDSNVATPVSGIVQAPVLLRTECEIGDTNECRIGGVAIGARAVVPVPGTNGELRLLVDEVRPDIDPQPAELVFRVITNPDVADLIKVGDADDPGGVDAGHAATVAAVINRQTVTGERAVRLAESSGDLVVESKTPDRFAACELLVRIGLDPTTAGWRYKGQPIRVGAPLLFTTGMYAVRGSIQRITIKTPSGSAPAGR